MDSFVTHLASLLACYETSKPFGGVDSDAARYHILLPSYDGPSDARKDSITRSVSTLVGRMWKAEEALTKYESRFKGDVHKEGEGRPHSVIDGRNLEPIDPYLIVSSGSRVEKTNLNPNLESKGVEHLTDASFDGQLVEEMTRVCNVIASGDLSEKVMGSGAQDRALVQLKDAINNMVDKLAEQMRFIEHVTTAVAQGDLTRKLEIQFAGKEVSTVQNSINSMIDQLSAFVFDVSDVTAPESLGSTCRSLGGAHQVQFHGIWAKLTRDLSKMKQATTQAIRSVFAATRSVALGDLTRRVDVQGLQGELLDLGIGVNGMIDWLNASVNEAIQILSEVAQGGSSSGLGLAEARGFDRANVRGVWKVLIDSVDAVALKVDEGRRGG